MARKIDDVLLRAEHFLRELSVWRGQADLGLTEAAREVILAHAWPGNARELQNAIERTLIVSDGRAITPKHLGVTTSQPSAESRGSSAASHGAPMDVTGDETLADMERRAIASALARAKGNKSQAAAALGLTRMQLYT